MSNYSKYFTYIIHKKCQILYLLQYFIYNKQNDTEQINIHIIYKT